jgi:hypothetical protein
MDRTRAQALQVLQMCSGRIPLVNGKIVAWVSIAFFNHYPVSGDFGDDGAGSNGQTALVSLYYGFERRITLGQGQGVYEKKVRTLGKIFQGR